MILAQPLLFPLPLFSRKHPSRTDLLEPGDLRSEAEAANDLLPRTVSADGRGHFQGPDSSRMLPLVSSLSGLSFLTHKTGTTGTSLVVQWLRLCAPNAGGSGLIPGQGTRSHTPQRSSCTWQ